MHWLGRINILSPGFRMGNKQKEVQTMLTYFYRMAKYLESIAKLQEEQNRKNDEILARLMSIENLLKEYIYR